MCMFFILLCILNCSSRNIDALDAFLMDDFQIQQLEDTILVFPHCAGDTDIFLSALICIHIAFL